MGLLCRSSQDLSIVGRGKMELKVFDFQELEAATGGFGEESLLGKGSHGCVYKAKLKNGKHVAVKRRKQEEGALDNELEILSEVRGSRLVNLLGYSQNCGEKVLVVEFMANGTLHDLLHGNPHPCAWPLRLHLALQVAKAVSALHCASPPVIHRDIKSQNVLIDRCWNAKLADFGLALRGNIQDVMRRPTPPAGTMGYLDPNYESPSQLSDKIDVFSFGILLLEIISGRHPIDMLYQPPRIADWALPAIKRGSIEELCDPALGPPDAKCLKQVAALAARCVRRKSHRRPSMAQVVDGLKSISRSMPFPLWGSLRNLVRRQQTCSTDKSSGKFLRSSKVTAEPATAHNGQAKKRVASSPQLLETTSSNLLLGDEPARRMRRVSDYVINTQCGVSKVISGSTAAITDAVSCRRSGVMAHHRIQSECRSGKPCSCTNSHFGSHRCSIFCSSSSTTTSHLCICR